MPIENCSGCPKAYESLITCPCCGAMFCGRCVEIEMSECGGCGELVCKTHLEPVDSQLICVMCRNYDRLEQAARKAAQSGSRTDLDKYLKLRRSLL
jgi:hypothetical protein